MKLRFSGAAAARAAVVAAGAAPLRGRRLQDDSIYDTPEESLRAQGCTLRVRRERGDGVLTLKGPAQPGIVKIREEHETSVGDADVLETVLRALGLGRCFRYQKYREEFAVGEVIVAVDETPIGTFVEIEGSERGILEAAQAMGRSPADFILDSYRVLFMAHQPQSGLAGTDMVFAGDAPSEPSSA